jgi:hypothetical protein
MEFFIKMRLGYMDLVCLLKAGIHMSYPLDKGLVSYRRANLYIEYVIILI